MRPRSNTVWTVLALATLLPRVLGNADSRAGICSVPHKDGERCEILPRDAGNGKHKEHKHHDPKDPKQEKHGEKRDLSLGIEPSADAMRIFTSSCSRPLKRKTRLRKKLLKKKQLKKKPLKKKKQLKKKPSKKKQLKKKPSKKKPSKKKQPLKRNPPQGFTELPVGVQRARRPYQNGLWSGAFGTCVGIVITGRNIKRDGWVAYMYHVLLDADDWTRISRAWDSFTDAVRGSGLYEMRAYMYTPDTRWNAADVFGDHYMEDLVREIEPVYERIQHLLGRLTQNHVERLYHAFSSPGEMSVDIYNQVHTTP